MSQTSQISHNQKQCVCDYQQLQRNKPKFQGQSTTQSHFKAYKIEKQPQFVQPKVVQKHYDKQYLQSSYKSQYQAPVTNTANNFDAAARYQYKPKKAQFYSDTQYKNTFKPHQIKKQRQPQYVYKPKDTKFQGATTYKTEFKEKKNNQPNSTTLAGYQVLQSDMNSYYQKRPKVPFQGTSAYKESFPGYKVKPQKQPQYVYKPKNTKFEGETSYKTNFKPYGVQAYKSDLQLCPVHPGRFATK